MLHPGAAQETGAVLLFLHADTRLPGKFDEHILKCLRRPGVVAGAFKLRLGSRKPALRFIECLANWRSRWMKTPYGDQAIFISAKLFHQIGGFPGIPIMEDFELVRQLRKRGGVVTLPVSVFTSARRWEKFGILKTTLLNQLVILAHFVGVPLDIIAKWYHREKET